MMYRGDMVDFSMNFSLEAMKLWVALEDELRNANRFFAKSDILKQIETISQNNVVTIDETVELFRARIYEEDKFVRLSKKETQLDKLNKARNEALGFYGYSKDKSGAPPNEKAKEGRGNPKFISYLYLGSSQLTSLAEVRPFINEKVSIAKVNVKGELKLIDFSNYIGLAVTKSLEDAIYTVLGYLFSIPINVNKKDDYLYTQYITEFIKTLGYDGIIYRSSLSDGKNYLIYDPSKAEIISSELFRVTNMSIQARCINPEITEFIGGSPLLNKENLTLHTNGSH